MKRYVLAIVVLLVVFLGWGNVVAQNDCSYTTKTACNQNKECKWYVQSTISGCVHCSDPRVCCGISLNTKVPFIGNCLETRKPESATTAFPRLMGGLTQILVTIILIISFVLIIIGGIMIATGNPSEGKKMIIKVVIGIALLGASGVILRLINPNFFG